MKLTFLGTRGYIEARSQRHAMHSSLLVISRGRRVLVDCGEDWLGRLAELRPGAIVVTHAHPDHAFGLKEGAPCPVWATAESWEKMKDFPVGERRTIRPRRPVDICGITFEAFDGIHIPFENSFDVIFIANVLHHVPFENHVPILKHLYEKLKDGGTLFLFEHNPLNPLTVRAVNTCEFDRDAKLLNPLYANRVLKESGFARRNIRFVIFFPKFLSFLIPLEKYLRKLPLGAQYYFCGSKG